MALRPQDRRASGGSPVAPGLGGEPVLREGRGFQAEQTEGGHVTPSPERAAAATRGQDRTSEQ